jgi:recombination protein RecT
MTDSKEVAKAPTYAQALEAFRGELHARADEIGSQLPSNIPRDRFLNAAIAAVRATPDLLNATRRSAFSALTKAAQDGLLPDGREGIITVYSVKGTMTAQWNPMVYGIRKRAREVDGIIIGTEVVYENDEFEQEAGDNPTITHKPAKLGTDRGKAIGVYAIFRHPQEGILSREVMSAQQVDDVREQSRAKGSLMWTKFWTEGWRKTVIRRGIKSVPVSPKLEMVVTRDDEQFDFAEQRQISAPTPPPLPPRLPPKPPAESDAEDQPADAPETPAAEADEADSAPGGKDAPGAESAGLLSDIDEALKSCLTRESVDEVFNDFDVQIEFADDEPALAKAFELRDLHRERVDKIAAAGDDFPGDR